MLLIDDLLMLPGRFLGMVFKEIYNRVQEEVNDPVTVQKELIHLQLLYEMDEISLEEYDQREAELIARLHELREQAKAY